MGKIRCKICNEVIESKYRHNLVWCSGKHCFVDGGDDYCRIGWLPGTGGENLEDVVDLDPDLSKEELDG